MQNDVLVFKMLHELKEDGPNILVCRGDFHLSIKRSRFFLKPVNANPGSKVNKGFNSLVINASKSN